MISLDRAVEICKTLEEVVPQFGCHVALTGGCLYKDGYRKDLDIVLYRIRQSEKIDTQGLWPALESRGLKLIKDHGWCAKCELFDGTNVDIFFPEVFKKTLLPVSDNEEYPQ